MISAVLISSTLLVALSCILWYRLPIWFAKPLRDVRVTELGLHAAGDDMKLVCDIVAAMNQGVALRLRHRTEWLDVCDAVAPKWRPMVVEGAAFGCGAIRATYSRKWRSMPDEWMIDRPRFATAGHMGIGLWGAFRFGREFEQFLRVVDGYDVWHRNACLDGYGFKFAFLDFPRDRRSVSHLHAIPGYYRRSAFHGVGRGLYLAFLSDRRGFIEAAADFAPHHDGDVIEGAAFSAAYVHSDDPRRAIRFARAMPYEWRTHAHLGLTLGLRERAKLDADFHAKVIAVLPRPWRDAIRGALTLADDVELRVKCDHAGGGYGLWRDQLSEKLADGQVWDPVYHDGLETRSDGEGAVR